MVVEVGLDRGQSLSLDHHHRWCRCLVVAGPSGDVQVEQGPFEPRSVGFRSTGRRRLEGDGFLELRAAVEAVSHGQNPRRFVEDTLGDPERANGARVEPEGKVHRATSVVVSLPAPGLTTWSPTGGCAR